MPIHPSGAEVPHPGARRWRVDDYEHLLASLQLERVELIDGLLLVAPSEPPAHADAADAVYQLLLHRHPGARVRQSGSIRFGDHSLWDPDVYMTVDRDFASAYPPAADVLLAVEVAISTWRRDTRLKLPVYAAHGVPETWVLRPVAGAGWELVRCTEPEVGGYRSMTTVPLPDGPGTVPA
jgi:Uma2 family endonuclease